MLLRSLLAACALLALAVPAVAKGPAAPITIRNQSDGVNALRMVTVAAYCRGPAACAGTARLVKAGQTLARAPFSAPVKTTFKTPMRLRATSFKALHAAKRKTMVVTLTLTLADGRSFSHPVTLHL